MVGSKIGNYRIVRLIGEGGMGRVFEAVHDQIERRAAIKVLHAQYAHNSEAYARFLNEARAVNIVQHPGVVSIYEFGQTEDGSPYIVMEFLEGESLASRLQRLGRMSIGAVRVARQVSSALAAAHARQVIHRDLKPANVMLVPDPDMPGGERAKVVDFGIAKLNSQPLGGGYKTRAGAVLGTPAYMAPEQCRGAGEVTDKTDVYALGVMIFEMLTGRPPFVAEGEGEVMAMHMFKVPPALHTLEPTLPLDLVKLVHNMLAKEPGERPSMSQVAGELDRIGARMSGPRPAMTDEQAQAMIESKPAGPLTWSMDASGALVAPAVPVAPLSPPDGGAPPAASAPPVSLAPSLPTPEPPRAGPANATLALPDGAPALVPTPPPPLSSDGDVTVAPQAGPAAAAPAAALPPPGLPLANPISPPAANGQSPPAANGQSPPAANGQSPPAPSGESGSPAVDVTSVSGVRGEGLLPRPPTPVAVAVAEEDHTTWVVGWLLGGALLALAILGLFVWLALRPHAPQPTAPARPTAPVSETPSE